MLLTKSQILEAKDLPTKDVYVPEWGGTVRIKTMTALEKDQFEKTVFSSEGKVNMEGMRAKLCAHTIIDENGQRLFSEFEIEKLGGKGSKALERVFTIAQELNGISNKDLKEMEKNSGTDQSESFNSD